MTKTIYFDMDGTIANLYGVEGWLNDLINSNTRPYAIAKPLVNFARFARVIHKAQRMGYRVGVISWLSKNSTKEFDAEVTRVKREWLATHLPSVEFDEINIVPYGTPKSTVATTEGYLFDDEEGNRNEWGEGAYNVDNIFEDLAEIIG